MSIYPPPNNIKDITVIIFILLGFPLFLSAQEPDLDKSGNRGHIECQQLPETKKEETGIVTVPSITGSIGFPA